MSEARVVTEDDQEFTRFPLPRLLNRRARARISEQPVPWELNKGALCVNTRFGWYGAVTCQAGNYEVALSSLSKLRQALLSASEDIGIASQKTLALGNTQPLKIFFACNDSVLIVAFTSGTLRIYEVAAIVSADISSPTYAEVQAQNELLDAIPNPFTSPETATRVALVGVGGNLDILDVQTKNIVNCTSGASAAAWSKDGQALAIGSSDGLLAVQSMSQGSSPKAFPALQQGSLPISSIAWITDTSLHITARSPTDAFADAVNVVASISSSGALLDLVKLPVPFPDREKYGTYAVALPRWLAPSDGAVLVTSDVCTDTIEIFAKLENEWCQRTVENPLQLPLSSEGEENILLALEADLTSTEGLRFEVTGETKDFPPSPILLAYLSDGTLQAWYIAHSSSYSGMSTGGEDMGVAAPPNTEETTQDMAITSDQSNPADRKSVV